MQDIIHASAYPDGLTGEACQSRAMSGLIPTGIKWDTYQASGEKLLCWKMGS